MAAGTVHALLGENGAGKTTLMRVAFGMIRPDAGAVFVDGQPRRFGAPSDAIAAGLGMVHQHYALVENMTVAENVALASGGTLTRDWRFNARDAATVVTNVAREMRLDVAEPLPYDIGVDPNARVGDLSVAAQQRVEIIKALARDARVLILDEPTAVLAPEEAAQLLRWLRRLADRGCAVVLITHKLGDALSVADDITVLRRGRTVLAAPAAAVDEATIVDAMLGAAAPKPGARRSAGTPGPVVIRADAIDIGPVRAATFAVHAGEIVGVVGVEGQGQVPLLRALAGRTTVTGGRLTVPSEVGFIPEDRQRDGLIADFPLYENVYLRGAGRRRGRARWAAVRQATADLLARYDIRTGGPGSSARSLSGGNQQRLVLAREIDDTPAALIASNPTRGLDVQAAAGLRDALLAARDRGTAIVWHSSDLDEVLDLADRVLVVARGAVREIPRARAGDTPAPFDREFVGRVMLGLS